MLIIAQICYLAVLTTGVVNGFSNPSRKSWWTKRVSSDSFHTAGRLSVRQIKYASEAGFKSVVSLFTYDQQVGESNAEGGNFLPTTETAREEAKTHAGIAYDVILDSATADWKNEETIQRFQQISRGSPKPLLFHATDPFAATFVLLASLANATAHGENEQHGEPKISGGEVFSVGKQLGFNFAEDSKLSEIVNNIASPGLESRDQTLPTTLDEWYTKYWWMKPVFKNWFISGQIQTDHLSDIHSVGVRKLVNSRRGMTTNRNPSQEEVTLLNIRDKTGTYSGEGRQTTEQLKKNRLDPGKSTLYISATATTNYESRNRLEFGDDIGYNEKMEQETIERDYSDIQYVQLPLGGQYGYSTAMWNAYKDSIKALGRDSVVLFQCRTGFRSSIMALLAAGYVNCLSSDWAITRAAQIGYKFDTKAPAALTLFKVVLDGRTDMAECIKERDEDTQHSGGAGTSPSRTTVWIHVLFVSVFAFYFL